MRSRNLGSAAYGVPDSPEHFAVEQAQLLG